MQKIVPLFEIAPSPASGLSLSRFHLLQNQPFILTGTTHGQVLIHSLKNPQSPEITFKLDRQVVCSDFISKSLKIILGDFQGNILLIDLMKNNQQVFKKTDRNLTCFRGFNTNPNLFYSGSLQGVTLHDTRQRNSSIHLQQQQRNVLSLDLSLNDDHLLSCSNSNIIF